MYLLGGKAWWLPRWLDRILPDVDVEGAKLHQPARAAAASPDAEPDAEPEEVAAR
jgi:RND superfamily putative drug exporter